MSCPESMRTELYRYGVEPLNGDDLWELFRACAAGNTAKVTQLLKKDRRLVNGQYWYQFPMHLAVYAGHEKIVGLLLKHGADPGQSRFTYHSWNKLLQCAKERGFSRIEALLERAMTARFHYSRDFEPLKEAIIARDIKKIASILRRKPELAAASDGLGNNPIHWSVLTRQLGLIKRFVELGTPIEAMRADGQTPVLLAVNGATDYWYRTTRSRSHRSLRNTSVIVGSLLALGAKYSISIAAAVGDQERIEELLAKDAGLASQRDSARLTPLTYSAREGHLHIVRLLLDHGADPNTPEECATDGRALFEACCENHLDVARLLLERGANPNAGMDSSGCCLTIGAAHHGDQARPIQQLLRDHGAYTPAYDMSVKEMKQAMASNLPVIHDGEFLESVIQKQDKRLLDLYLDSGCLRPKELDAGSPLTEIKSASVIRKLVDRGLDPQKPDWIGNTFLHHCARDGDCELAAVFLDAGADINAKDIEFQGTPLAAAVRHDSGNHDDEQAVRRRMMVEFLLKRGAATNLPDDQPWATPLAWARKRGLPEIETILIERGAT
jgi:ankyrin repeat protein